MLNLISEKSFQSTNQLVASQFSRMKCQFKMEIVTKKLAKLKKKLFSGATRAEPFFNAGSEYEFNYEEC